LLETIFDGDAGHVRTRLLSGVWGANRSERPLGLQTPLAGAGFCRENEGTMARWMARLVRTSPGAVDAGLLLLRGFFGLALALGHGHGKLLDLGKFIGSVAQRGIPLPGVLGPAAAFSEFLGGVLLAIGLLTRPAAAFVLCTMLVAGLHVHASDPFQRKELALAYAIVAMVVLLAGPGRFSLDALLARRSGR